MLLVKVISPKYFLLLFGFLLAIDFVSFYYNQNLEIFSSYYVFDYGYYLLTIIYFFLAFLASYLGLTVGEKINPGFRKTQQKPLTNLFVYVYALVIVVYFLFLFLFFSQGLSKQIFFRSFPLLSIIGMSIFYFYAYYLFLSKSSLKRKIIITIFIMTSLIISDSRGAVIFVVTAFALFYDLKVKKISTLKILAMSFSFIAFLLFSRFYLRESYRFDNLSEFIASQGSVFSTFFETVEFSQAEALYVLINFSDFFRGWYESILAGLMYLIPRSIAEFKPLGASSFFTEISYPDKWYISKSEIVVSGFGDAFLSFGWLGIIFLFFIFIPVGLLYKHYVRNNYYHLILILLYLEYSFLRGDLYNLAGKIWILLLFLVVKYMFDIISRRRV